MKKFLIEIQWTILFFIVSLLWMLGERLAGLHDKNIEHHVIISNLFAIVAVVIYVLALLDKRKNFYKGKINWIQGFISGLILSFGITLLTPLSQYLTIAIISPHFFDHMIDYSVEMGKMTLEEAEATFNMQSYLIQSTVFAPIAGILTSAIVAFFIKKK